MNLLVSAKFQLSVMVPLTVFLFYVNDQDHTIPLSLFLMGLAIGMSIMNLDYIPYARRKK